MKIGVISDIHIEFHWDLGFHFIRHLPQDLDILIIAGDLIPYIHPQAPKAIAELCTVAKHIVTVYGNHCLWRSSPEEINLITQHIQSKIPSNRGRWYPMNKDIVDINGVKFAGATTWFPLCDEAIEYQDHLNDFKLIKNFVPWVFEEHDRCLDFWRTCQADIWIAHHLPSYKSLSSQYISNKLNCYLVAPDVEKHIQIKQPKYFIHGHAHLSSDYQIGETRVICNPYGYETSDGKWLNRNFKFNLVFEV
jgi:predicted phosphodiesterase